MEWINYRKAAGFPSFWHTFFVKVLTFHIQTDFSQHVEKSVGNDRGFPPPSTFSVPLSFHLDLSLYFFCLSFSASAKLHKAGYVLYGVKKIEGTPGIFMRRGKKSRENEVFLLNINISSLFACECANVVKSYEWCIKSANKWKSV